MAQSLSHDAAYRQIFGDRHMMRELIRGFVPRHLWSQWDLASLERKDSSWVGEGQARREGDLVWRVRSQAAGEPWVYLYVLLEFQSRPDARMALRILGYVTMLLGSLLDTGEIGRKAGYPPVLPVVLYNGRRPWRVGTSLAERQHDVPLALRPFNPSIQFLLIDQNSLPAESLRDVANACVVFMQMERLDDMRGLPALTAQLAALLEGDEHAALRRGLLAWLEHVLLASLKRRMDVALDISLQGVGNLSEASKMLADRVDLWFQNAAREARREGLQEGLQAGRHEGLRQMVELWLTDRFGTELPAWVLHELEQADEAQLMRWARSISQSPSLAAVFDTPPN